MSELATLSFQPEAHDTAANIFRQCLGFTVTVVPVEGETFDATLVEVSVGVDDGQYKAVLAPWDEEKDDADLSKKVELDLFDDIIRLEVI